MKPSSPGPNLIAAVIAASTDPESRLVDRLYRTWRERDHQAAPEGRPMSASGKLVPAMIQVLDERLDPTDVIPVLFNPKEYDLSKRVWAEASAKSVHKRRKTSYEGESMNGDVTAGEMADEIAKIREK